jgi:hypothetical protein
MVHTMVLPNFAKSLRSWITLQAVAESKPVVGSSRKIRLGLVRSSTPIEALFLSPPETPLLIIKHFLKYLLFNINF